MEGIRLLKVTFKNYKVLLDKEVSFDENPFVIAENNEWGKSTLIEGIVDAFGLNTRDLQEKSSYQSKEKPYIELEFEIDGELYLLTVNAQDNSVELKSADGRVIKRNKKVIKKFLEEKGYAYFDDVVKKLLVLKERDLTVDVSSGLKKLFDAVLKTGKIEGLAQRIEGMLSSRGRGFVKDFGKLYREIEGSLSELQNSISQVLKQHSEYVDNVNRLERLEEELKTVEREKGKIQKEIFKNQLILKGVLDWVLEQVSKRLEDGKEKLLEGKLHIEEESKQLSELRTKLENVQGKIKELIPFEGEFSKVKEKLSKVDKLCDLWGKVDVNFSSDALEKELSDWRAYKGILEKTKGIIKILNAPGDVLINGKSYVSGEEVLFQGEAQIECGKLLLKVYASSGVKEAGERIEILSKKYKSIERLEEILRIVRKREMLCDELSCRTAEQAYEKRKKLKKRLEELETCLEELSQLEKKKDKLNEKIKEIEASIGNKRETLESLKEELSSLERFEDRMKDKLVRVEKEVEGKSVPSEVFGEVVRKVAKLGEDVFGAEKAVEELEDKLESLLDELSGLEEKKQSLQEEVKYYKGLTEKAPDSSELDELLKMKERLERRLSGMVQAERVLRYSYMVLNELKSKVNERYLERFSRTVGEIFSQITNGEYSEVRFEDDSLFFKEEVFKSGWMAIRRDGARFLINELSDGTKTQLLLAARLALIKLFVKKPAFLLLDEPFAYFDSKRTKEAMEMLKEIAKSGWQVVIATAKPFNLTLPTL